MARTLAELQQISVAAAPTAGQGLALGSDGKVPVSVLPRTLTGSVSSAGAATAGTGFTVAHTGTGVYTVTFTAAFTVAPIVIVEGIGTVVWRTDAPAAGSVVVRTFSTAFAAADADFSFVATEVR